jgi:transcriptional regulator with XRE-family HTH domain
MSAGAPFGERAAAIRIGKRLRDAREEAGLSLRELAQRVGLRDHTVLIKYERGETPPNSARLLSLAQALGCSAAALLAGRDETMALIAAVDQADDLLVAQLEFMLERLQSPPPERSED